MYLKGIFTFNFSQKKCSLVSGTVDKQTQKYFKIIYFWIVSKLRSRSLLILNNLSELSNLHFSSEDHQNHEETLGVN